jgi:hypothetical protein
MMQEMGPEGLPDLAKLEKLTDELGGLFEQMIQEVGKPVRLIAAVVRLLAQAEMFARLALQQKEIAQLSRRFEEEKQALSRMEQVELQEIAAAERQVRDGLQGMMETIPELLKQVPDDEEYKQFKQTTEEFLKKVREAKDLPWLRPDGKSQVTVQYDEKGKPVRVHTVVVSTQHADQIGGRSISNEEIREGVISQVVSPVIPARYLDENTIYHINPTGRFVVGGPHGDSGLTGRKIIVDTYGGKGSHGGGAFSGKDPSKVDRSAAYMARHIAKNIVAAGLAEECEVQLSYAIGVADPLSINVETNGTGRISDVGLARIIRNTFPLKPRQMIEYLNLLRPIYRKTAQGGHFGRELPEFTWEELRMVDELKQAARACK